MAVKKEENVLKGSTLVDSITYELIDYCGDIKKIGRDNLRKKSVVNDVTSAIKDRYSPTFSPNNIRKIVFSPNKTIVYYHIPVTSANLYKKTYKYNSEKYCRVSNKEDYIPLIDTIINPVCASVEEVIYCALDNDGRFPLIDTEFMRSNLVKGVNGGKDELEKIKIRFKRLHSITVLKCTVDQFEQALESTGKIPKNGNIPSNMILTNVPNIKELVVKDKSSYIRHEDNADKWILNYGSSAQVYKMDENGSELNLHFKQVKEKYLEKKEQSKKDAVKAEFEAKKKEAQSEADEKAKKTIQDLLDKYINVVKAISKYNGMVAKIPEDYKGFYSNNFGGATLGRINVKATLPLSKETYENADTKKYNIVLSDTTDETSAVDLLKRLPMDIYRELVGQLVDMLYCIGQTKPRTLKTIMKMLDDNSCAINVNVCKSQEKVVFIKETSGKIFEGKSFNDSFANACKLLVVLYMYDSADDNLNSALSKYKEKETWMTLLQGK